jgi:CDP-diglyceride synthetase
VWRKDFHFCQLMRLKTVSKLLFLLGVANGAPIAVKDVLGHKLAYPVDGGTRLPDGRRLFGKSKTVRGVVASVVFTSVAARAFGFRWKTGAAISSVAMTGDLCSSFLKRRLDVPTSGRSTGLDQIPESLFPLLVVRRALDLSEAEIAAGVGLFFAGEVLFSMLLYRAHLRERPY